MGNKNTTYTLVTGGNSGVGLGVAERLIDEFIQKEAISQSLTLIITTRSTQKSEATILKLRNRVDSLAKKHPDKNVAARIALTYSNLDLADIKSVALAAEDLNSKYPKMDTMILNAGMGAFIGIDWVKCTIDMIIRPLSAFTTPRFKLQEVGRVTKQQVGTGEIGTIFASNFFGHYYLVHEVMGLLRKGGKSGNGGRVVWTGSLEAYDWSFDPEDLECRKATNSYEASKRLTDVISLTARLEATKHERKSFFSLDTDQEVPDESADCGVKLYLTHPGICVTNIFPMNASMSYGVVLCQYYARLLGSPWHTISTYSAANAPVWIAYASEEELEEKNAWFVKWGSGSDWWGREVLRETEVDRDGDEAWGDLGKLYWRKVEECRKQWKAKLNQAGGIS
ncbi:3-keto-steroid reductase [Rhizina undulata]